MPGLFSKVTQFARSPQGKRLTAQAKRAASDPKNRARIDQVRARFAKRRA